MTILKTTLTRYSCNLDNADDRAEYKALRERLEGLGIAIFNVIAMPGEGRSKQPPEGELELDCKCLFDNQWNTVSTEEHNGWRVFDWYEGIVPNKRIKEGYYLDVTDEMREIRRNTVACGYCGHQEPAAKGNVFCDRCLDSEYLKEEELHLLRLVPVCAHRAKYVGGASGWLMTELVYNREQRAKLTDAEREHLLPLYIKRQTTGSDSRNANKLRKQRERIAEKHAKAIENANAERDGFTWLMDQGWPIDNVIYYDHTSKFGFGWRQPLGESVVSKLLEIISEFPFPYEIKGICPIEGTKRTWEGY